ncbi:MAG: T9SS type A sorting domain-containing protein [Bacteroidales bacterium]|nr:T9SS type A sorting domain-containing protein [Bacteroidales bacterium]
MYRLHNKSHARNHDLDIESNIDIYSDGNNLYINSEYDNLKVEIFNLKGQLLLQKNISNKGRTIININYPKSIYFVKAVAEKETLCKKVVLSK